MILPIGHQERTVRRLPWVTLTLIGLCVIAFLFTDTGAGSADQQADVFEEAADYWRQRAYLEPHPEIREHVAYDVMPNQRRQYLATLPDLSPYGPEEDGGRGAQQAELDRLTDLALGLAAPGAGPASDFERWGIVPAALRAHTLVTHMFVHGDWLHLLGNLFMLFLAGPAIEDRWGRATFAGFYGLAGLFAAFFYIGMTGADSAIPMVGASGAIAGVLGAFLVRLWSTRIRFAYFFLFGFRPVWGTFEAPAWAMLSLWFANELVQAWVWDSVGLAGGIAYWAHVGGFLFGTGAAFGVRSLQIEEKWVNPAVEAQLTAFSANPVLEDAMAARERGELGEAMEMLRAEWERAPEDDGIATAWWDVALASGAPAAAAPALLGAVRAAARRGELELALRHWWELSDHAPAARPEPALLLRFVPVLLGEDQRDRAALALRQAAEAVEATDVAGDTAEAAGAAAEEPAWDADGAISLARFARAKLVEARPVALEADGLRLQLEGEREARVGWGRVQAVAVAILGGLGAKPVLVIDLLANWNDAAAEALQGVRLRSDRFDPRALLGGGGDPKRAYAALAARLLEATRAEPLPSVEAALGNPWARYDSPEDYARIVLEVAE